MSSPPFQRALIIRGGALGDFLLTVPTIAALRAAAPDSHIEILAYPSIASIVCSAGIANDVRPIEYAPLAGFFTHGTNLNPDLQKYFASFDLVISYLYDPDGFFAANLRASGVKNLIQGSHYPSGTVHAAHELAAPLEEIGIPFPEKSPILNFKPTESTHPIIAIHVGSGSPSKNWPVHHWANLIQSLQSELPHHLAFIGGEADASIIETIRPFIHSDRSLFWENLPLPHLASLLAGSQFYIGHDTGISHLAATAGVKSLLLFGPTNPAIWAPPYEHVHILRAPDNSLENLPPPTVLGAIKKLLPTD